MSGTFIERTGTLAQCKSACESGAWAGCVGFSRYTHKADDDASARCWYVTAYSDILADDDDGNEATYTLTACQPSYLLLGLEHVISPRTLLPR